MSLTQDLVAVTQAADQLTQQVANKISDIDQRVAQFEADAQQTVATATAQIKRANIGVHQQPEVRIMLSADDDAGELANQAYANGAKSVVVDWVADGQERHWNTLARMPAGTTLRIQGPNSKVDSIGGAPRGDRACYKLGSRGGTSTLGSPLIFRNLEVNTHPVPVNKHFQVNDLKHLISMDGNNTVVFGDGTYLHDQGGMVPCPRSNGLISITSYRFGLTNYVVGGGHYCQFYLSGPLVNNTRGTSEAHVRIMAGNFQPVSSDGPTLDVDKGFRRLKNRGVAIDDALLRKQLYALTSEECALNDNEYPKYTYGVKKGIEHIDGDNIVPRLIGCATWSYPSGYTFAQFSHGAGGLGLTGLAQLEGSNVYLGGH